MSIYQKEKYSGIRNPNAYSENKSILEERDQSNIGLVNGDFKYQLNDLSYFLNVCRLSNYALVFYEKTKFLKYKKIRKVCEYILGNFFKCESFLNQEELLNNEINKEFKQLESLMKSITEYDLEQTLIVEKRKIDILFNKTRIKSFHHHNSAMDSLKSNFYDLLDIIVEDNRVFLDNWKFNMKI